MRIGWLKVKVNAMPLQGSFSVIQDDEGLLNASMMIGYPLDIAPK